MIDSIGKKLGERKFFPDQYQLHIISKRWCNKDVTLSETEKNSDIFA